MSDARNAKCPVSRNAKCEMPGFAKREMRNARFRETLSHTVFAADALFRCVCLGSRSRAARSDGEGSVGGVLLGGLDVARKFAMYPVLAWVVAS